MLKHVRNCISLSHSSSLLLYVDCIAGYVSQHKLSSLQECCCSQCCSLVRWYLMCICTCSSFVYWYLHWWKSVYWVWWNVAGHFVAVTKAFFALVRNRLWQKIPMFPEFTTIVTGHGKLRSCLHRFGQSYDTMCPCDSKLKIHSKMSL